MAAVNRSQLAAELAVITGSDDSATCAAAVDAAVTFVERCVEIDELQSDPITDHALIGFSRAMYLDRLASRGQVVAMGDTTADSIFSPEDPWQHWRHFFEPLREAWGIG
jgi:hypothetical protein